MTLSQLAFALLAALTLSGALGATTLRTLTSAVLSLVVFFLGLAGFFFMLRADFLGVVQVLVYVGAVAVLIVFAIVMTRGHEGGRDVARIGGLWLMGTLTACSVGALLVFAVMRSPDKLVAVDQPVGSTEQIGTALMTTYVLPFELASLLLTAALVGAIVVAMDEVARGDAGRKDRP